MILTSSNLNDTLDDFARSHPVFNPARMPQILCVAHLSDIPLWFSMGKNPNPPRRANSDSLVA